MANDKQAKKLKLTDDDVTFIMRKLRDGYHDRKDYPPFAIAPWDDRNRYIEYVEKVLRDIR